MSWLQTVYDTPFLHRNLLALGCQTQISTISDLNISEKSFLPDLEIYEMKGFFMVQKRNAPFYMPNSLICIEIDDRYKLKVTQINNLYL